MSRRLQHWLRLGWVTAERFRWTVANRRQASMLSQQRGQLSLTALERRLLMSATPIDPSILAGDGLSDHNSSDVVVAFQSDRGTTIESVSAASQGETVTGDRNEVVIVFVDAAVENLESVLADVTGNSNGAEVFVLDSDRDGIEVISEVLKSKTDVGQVHLVTHADGDSVRLGNVLLNNRTIHGFAGQIATWGSSLTSDADVVFYGCDLAASSSGQELIESVAALTGADVAASTDDTGHVTYGGNWEFEFTVGEIATDSIFSNDFQEAWRSKLSIITVTTTDDTIDGADGVVSLREAILLAGDGDTIILQAERYDLTRVGWGSLHGDLDLSHDITILGAGTDTTQIRSQMGHRVFDIRDSSNVTISGVTIEDGEAQLGGGIRIRVGSSLDLTQVVIENSDASVAGGGIYNQGNLTIIDSRIVGNRSDGDGAGVYSDGLLDILRSSVESNRSDTLGGGIFVAGGTANLINVTVSGNDASIRGGGIYNRGSSRLTHNTVTNNTAPLGGGVAGEAGTIQFEYSIIADNAGSTGDDLQGTGLVSLGFNLIGSSNNVTGLIANDLRDIASGLAALTDNGGFSRTHAFATYSAAVDAAVSSTSMIDGRGQSRPSDGDGNGTFIADIGAFELSTPGTGGVTVTTTSGLNDTGSAAFSLGTLLSNRGTDGRISLTEAIIAANNTPGVDTITFNIAGTGPHVISINDPLPTISSVVVIDGTTQTGFVDRPVIFVDGGDQPTNGIVLGPGSGGSTIRGLGLINFGFNAININSSGNTIAGNWLGGFDPATGAYDPTLRNGHGGVYIATSGNTIGGPDTSDRNLIGGNEGGGVTLDGGSASDNTVQGNWIGITSDGNADTPLGLDGIGIYNGADDNLIKANVIGNSQNGIHLVNASNNELVGNAIGTDFSQTRSIGNAINGIRLDGNSDDNTIGRFGAGNVIVGNATAGVAVLGSSDGNIIRFNQITGNGQLAIDLDGDGSNPNDPLDLDSGGNLRQNRPTLNTANVSAAGELSVNLELQSGALQTYRIDFYEASTQPGSVGDPLRYLGFSIVPTPASGFLSFNAVGTVPWVTGGGLIVATATDSQGNTSEFSSSVIVVAPNSAPTIGNIEPTELTYFENGGPRPVSTSITVFDADFDTLTSATITIGGYQSDQDLLAFTETTDISGSWNSVTGVLTLTGNASVNEYQTALRSVTYENTSDNPEPSARNISLVVSDGVMSSNLVTRTVITVRSNDPTFGAPVLPMTVTENQVVTVDVSSIGDLDGVGAFSYQWYSNGIAITGADTALFIPGNQHVGNNLSVSVTFVDGMGNSITLSSGPTNKVQNVDDPSMGNPVITGTAMEDQTLGVLTSTISDADGLDSASFTYQWQRNSVDIVGATGDTYLLGDDDVNSDIRVAVSFTDDHGTATTLTSNAVGPIANVNDLPTGVPVISGTFVEQDRLTAKLGGISDDDGLPSSADFQWFRNGVAINGATNRTYQLTIDDVDQPLSVQVTYVDLHGTKETVISPETPPIDNFNDAPTLMDRSRNISFGETLLVGTKLFQGASNDVDGDSLQAVLVSGPKKGTIELKPDGSFRYTPDPQFFGTVSFSWQADDGSLVSNVATVTIVIAPPINTPGASTGSNGETVGEPTETGSSGENETPDGDGGVSSDSDTNSGGTNIGTSVLGGGALPSESDESEESVTAGVNEDSGSRLVSFRENSNEDDERSIDRGLLEDRFREIDSIESSSRRNGSGAAGRNNSLMTGMRQWADYALLGSPGEMWDQLDSNQYQLESLLEGEQLIVGSFGAATGGFTVIALAWLRNGFLVLGFWQQRPLWSRMDPLVLMQGLRSQDDESLEDVIADQRRKLDHADGHEPG